MRRNWRKQLTSMVWVMHWTEKHGCIIRIFSSCEKAVKHLAEDCILPRWDQRALGPHSGLTNVNVVSNYFKQYEGAIIETHDFYSNKDMEWTAPDGPRANVFPARIDAGKEISELSPKGNT